MDGASETPRPCPPSWPTRSWVRKSAMRSCPQDHGDTPFSGPVHRDSTPFSGPCSDSTRSHPIPTTPGTVSAQCSQLPARAGLPESLPPGPGSLVNAQGPLTVSPVLAVPHQGQRGASTLTEALGGGRGPLRGRCRHETIKPSVTLISQASDQKEAPSGPSLGLWGPQTGQQHVGGWPEGERPGSSQARGLHSLQPSHTSGETKALRPAGPEGACPLARGHSSGSRSRPAAALSASRQRRTRPRLRPPGPPALQRSWDLGVHRCAPDAPTPGPTSPRQAARGGGPTHRRRCALWRATPMAPPGKQGRTHTGLPRRRGRHPVGLGKGRLGQRNTPALRGANEGSPDLCRRPCTRHSRRRDFRLRVPTCAFMEQKFYHFYHQRKSQNQLEINQNTPNSKPCLFALCLFYAHNLKFTFSTSRKNENGAAPHRV